MIVSISLGIFCSIAIGALCAPLHCRVYVILAVSAFLAAGATVGGVIFHTHFWMIAAEGIGLIAAAQFGYVAVGLTLQYWLDAAFRGVGSAKSRNSMRRDHQRQRSSSMLRSSRWHKEEVARASFSEPFRFCEGRAFSFGGPAPASLLARNCLSGRDPHDFYAIAFSFADGIAYLRLWFSIRTGGSLFKFPVARPLKHVVRS
jgi:hypothetical protein